MKRLALVLCGAVLAAGCGGDRDAPGAKTAPQPAAQAEPKPILGRKTQKIVDLKKERDRFQEAPVEARASDGMTFNPGRAYAGTVSRTQQLSIKHAIDLFHATEGRYPKDYDEFMTRIIKANHVKLPVLPGHLEYAYDSDSHELKIVKKKQ